MRVIFYFFLLAFLFVSCDRNQQKHTSTETDNHTDEINSTIGSDTLFTTNDEVLLDTSVPEETSNEMFDQEIETQEEFIPKLDAQEGKDKFKNTVEYHYKRGLVLFKLNNYVDGVKEFDTAITMDSDRTNSYINRGKGLMELKRWDAARRDFEKAVNLNSRDTTSYQLLAMAQYQLGNYQEAVEANTELIILAPRNANGYCNRGIAYGVLKEFDKAITDFNQAIAINPKYAEAFFNRGLAYYFTGDKKAACEDWELAKFYGHQKAIGTIDNYCE